MNRSTSPSRDVAEQLAEQIPVVVARRRLFEHDVPVALGEPAVVVADRRQRRLVARDEQLVVPRELHERVVPVEEDGLKHSAARVTAWRGGSSGHRLP